MKIPCTKISCLDETLIFHQCLEGIIVSEKCQVDGKEQYWYDISGKQALDNYCKLHLIGQELFEQLLLEICNQLELLEWNLIDGCCLMLKPEFIFLNNNATEISFVLYPTEEGNLLKELRELMEYLLTKLNHQEKDAVCFIYELYEVILTEAFSVKDLKNRILERRRKEISMENIVEEYEPQEMITYHEKEVLSKKGLFNTIENRIKVFMSNVKRMFGKYEKVLKPERTDLKEHSSEVVYPEDEEKGQILEIHPTVCITSMLGEPKGILRYEGGGDYSDFEIEQMMCVIGKSHRVKLQIEKDTISQFHAKIEYLEGNYYIEDMNSTNGTFVNDEILNYKERRILNVGDFISFADVKYRFL